MDATTAPRSRAWRLWRIRWTLVSALPASLSVLFWGLVPMCWVSVLIVAVVLLVQLGNQPSGTPRSVGSVVRAVRPIAPCCITSALGLAVLADLSASAALVVAILAAASSPPAVAWYRRVEGADRLEAASELPVDATTGTKTLAALLAGPAQRMTDAQLCKAWRDSFVALREASTVRETMLIVALRQSVMDALGARHPLGVQAWLESDPQASGGPDRFLAQA